MIKWMVSLLLMLTLAVYVSGCEKKETAEKSGGQQAASETANAGMGAAEEKSDAMESEAEETEEAEAPEQAEMEAPGEAEEGAAEEAASGAVDLASLASAGTLAVEGEGPGAAENKEGIAHFKEGHWDVAEKHFRAAIDANPELAEAHYNLALALDKMGNHGDATSHFGKALELAPDDPRISGSAILNKHLGK